MGPGQDLHPFDQLGVSRYLPVVMAVGAHQIRQDLGVTGI